MALSGGMDSTTLLGYLLQQGMDVYCCVFRYPTKHNTWEIQATRNILQFYKQRNPESVTSSVIDISPVMTSFQSGLLVTGGEIPEGHYHADSMRLTVVPGRNTIFVAIMLGIAESLGAKYVTLGVHGGDHHIYPDCRLDYLKALNNTIQLASENKVNLLTPFSAEDKVSILKRGLNYTPPVPYHLTRTCYKNQILSCGKCGSCNERLEAFACLKMKDPIQYDDGREKA